MHTGEKEGEEKQGGRQVRIEGGGIKTKFDEVLWTLRRQTLENGNAGHELWGKGD